MSANCSFCGSVSTKAPSTHLRTCTKYIWSIPHHYPTQDGPMIPIKRDAQDRIICKCITTELIACTKSFPNKAQLDRHLKTVNPMFWTVCI